MTTEGIFHSIQNYVWRFAKNGWVNMVLGKNAGVWAFQFKQNGCLDYAATVIDFLPAPRFWRWNEKQQQIELLNENMQLVSVLEMPYMKNGEYILRIKDSDDLFHCYPSVEVNRMAKWAPAPLLAADAHTATAAALVQLTAADAPTLFPSLELLSVFVGPSIHTNQFWKQAYQVLLDHPNWHTVFASQAGSEKLLNQFGPDKITMIYQRNQLVGIGGTRAILIELLGQLQFEETLAPAQMTDSTLSALCNQYFVGRILKLQADGRAMTDE
ncbi:hypothetical protein IV38_GL001910 [Lactobacillus selangorensis]|uniref:Uncharacterized protein n=1 Tax=Lactobacillus selangorensis TaxID=81857 RepID=A0A0R2FGE1_9LACO|nr:hypothetical protein [Lactobacillus selangorensis]KRN27697.1 hypothetical protein IV38_GL001910 [Lactobacillus selangorensis]KRN30338.1 hypothetical protein IV40_GL001927 [Lactobacillus selangorensis]